MYNTVHGETVFFFTCIAAGVVTAFLYDLLRISRRLISVSAPIVNGQDILFFALAAVILFYTAFLKNSGEIRWQGFLGGFLGVAGYGFFIRNRFVNLGEAALKWLIKTLIWLFKVIMFPIGIILRALKKPIFIIAWYTGRALRRARGVAKCQGARAKMRILSAVSMRKKK